MKKWLTSVVSFILITALLAGCGNAGGSNETKEGTSANTKTKTVKWFVARGVNNPAVETVKELAEEFKKTNPGFQLVVEGTGDRPSYLQKLRTLIASNEMPDMFDTDPDAFAKKLVDEDMLVDVKGLLDDLGKTDDFRPIALSYQQFSDGSMYTLPLEYGIEVFWYNKRIFQEAGVNPPTTFDEFLDAAKKLKSKGITPIAIDGKDKWPMLRYLGFLPFRQTGNDYLEKLKKGEESLTDPVGMQAIEFIQELGTKKYLQEGFTATDYTAARDLFLSGKAAIYYMGSWETLSFSDENLTDEMKGNVSYFKMPMTANATTQPNDYFMNSGIGVAFNKQTFDETTENFIAFVLDHYAEAYAKKGQFTPQKYELDESVKMPPLYLEILKDINSSGTVFGIPWDARLDPATNELIGNQINALGVGGLTPVEFARQIDAAIKENAKKYFTE
ncbi:ABC transporter substrate-binding protein [Paenibacillus sp. Soil522]|uniref:ABC transporter substrate-binding protein n=1 Tax=Paenibacillus sp. Soil522 TaxID=1736388 RepID=UPI0006F90B11|nr:extracellular solute-binding protein [Paenibacillus sp. Soil522]KRE35252.1 hypothetical protein ASG81_22015 [Paenibacillus sp. Soil522]